MNDVAGQPLQETVQPAPRRSYRGSLLRGVVLYLVLLSAVGLISLYFAHNSLNDMHVAADHHVHELMLIDQINARVGMIRSTSLLHVLSSSASERATYEAQIRDQQVQTEALLDELVSTQVRFGDQGDIQTIASFRGAWRNYQQVMDAELFPLSRLDNDLAAAAMAAPGGSFDRAYREARAQLAVLQASLENESADQLAQSQDQFNRNQLVLLVMVVLLAALGVTFGLAQTARLARAVRTLSRAAQAVAGGDLTQKITVHTGDELEALAGSFNSMTASLRSMAEAQADQVRMLASTNASLQAEVAERLRVEAALNARHRELLTLQRISEIGLRNLSLEDAYREIVEEISVTTSFAIVAIEHYDAQRQVMQFMAARGLPEQPGFGAFEVPLDRTLSGSVVRSGEPLVETNVSEHRDHIDERLGGLGVETFVCVPMRVSDRVIGVLSLADRRRIGNAADLLPWVITLGNHVASVVERQRAAEEKLQLYREQVARAEAEAGIRLRDDFLAVATHELRSPVSALLAFTQLLLSRLKRGRVPPKDELVTAIEDIQTHAAGLARLSAQLLDTTSLQVGKLVLRPETTDVVQVVRAAIQSAAHGRTVALEAPPRLLAVVDPVRMGQVLTNLLSNAIKFSPCDSSVDVEVCEPRPGTVRISVRDFGVGVPPEHRPHIFERFYQVQSGQSIGGAVGMGLGLHISRRLVELHGGQIVAEHPAEGGTRFVVTIPTNSIPGHSGSANGRAPS